MIRCWFISETKSQTYHFLYCGIFLKGVEKAIILQKSVLRELKEAFSTSFPATRFLYKKKLSIRAVMGAHSFCGLGKRCRN
jgi:predicted transcriptional regulator